MQAIKSTQEFEETIENQTGVLAYFSHDKCSVCKTLKPKIDDYFSKNFPKIKCIYINTEETPELAAKYSVFTVPVILVFFEGKETYRKARNIGIQEIAELVERPYSMLFN